ncbi:hypothetical protein EDB83DRAFT_2530379 [Lactarius deliciosus]|nr:hypothetical protein EDB83DRAFT_2530379 [Lactarius deliciosus]
MPANGDPEEDLDGDLDLDTDPGNRLPTIGRDNIKNILHHLPNLVSPSIKLGLMDVHCKLSDYYYQFDASPFYTWAMLLDPQISYKGLKKDYADNLTLSDHLEWSKANLYDYFNQHYMVTNMPVSLSAPSASALLTAQSIEGSPQKSFTARYCRKEKGSTNELKEYFKLPAEDFNTCDPILWWVS